ncbi:hypothetical protein A7K94_0221265, partial [Modestobacter sp. VKM Ac-2676]
GVDLRLLGSAQLRVTGVAGVAAAVPGTTTSATVIAAMTPASRCVSRAPTRRPADTCVLTIALLSWSAHPSG